MMTCNTCSVSIIHYLVGDEGQCLLCLGTGFMEKDQAGLVPMVKNLRYIESICPKIPEESEQELRDRLGKYYIEF